MAKHIEIKIRVAYDEAHPLPTEVELKRNVQAAVGIGLLTAEDSVVEEWSVEVETE